MDPAPDPSVNKQKKLRKTLISIVFGLLNDWLYLKTDVNIPTVKSRAGPRPVIQCTDKHPDPTQNITDLEHWFCLLIENFALLGGNGNILN